jgi:sterol 3beta-glucosyltransferase
MVARALSALPARAGIPTLIKPWFGDQHFWALRVTKLEVGMKVASLHSSDIADALKKASHESGHD